MGKHLISSPGKCLPIVLLLFRSLFYVCLNIPFIHCILKNIDTIAFDNVQEAYWSMASALSEADGIDYTDPEEVQILWTHICDLMEKLIELRLFSLFVQLPALSLVWISLSCWSQLLQVLMQWMEKVVYHYWQSVQVLLM